jgi:hypothetical protein
MISLLHVIEAVALAVFALVVAVVLFGRWS